MTRTVVIEPEAEEDLAAAAAWYERSGPGLGDAFIEAARDAVERLTEPPDGSTPMPGVETRRVVRRVFVRKFPYAVVFVVRGETAYVVAFAHMRRRPHYWRSRVP